MLTLIMQFVHGRISKIIITKIHMTVGHGCVNANQELCSNSRAQMQAQTTALGLWNRREAKGMACIGCNTPWTSHRCVTCTIYNVCCCLAVPPPRVGHMQGNPGQMPNPDYQTNSQASRKAEWQTNGPGLVFKSSASEPCSTAALAPFSHPRRTLTSPISA